MSLRVKVAHCVQSLVLCLLVAHGLDAADGTPWTDQWSMNLRGVERWFAEYEKVNYLEVVDADLDDVTFLVGKDVLIQGKFKRVQNNGVELYAFPILRMGAATEQWSTIVDGDNVYVLGKVRSVNSKGELNFRSAHILRAPSDAIVIAGKLSEIDDSDLDARVQFAAWVRKTGSNMGNRNVWMTAADNIVEDAVIVLARQAQKEKSISKLLKAMKWCTESLSDGKRAASLGSAAWVSEVQGDAARRVSEQMGKLGLTALNGEWVTKREKVIRDFDTDLAAIKSSDAQAYYDLAMSIISYRDALPEAIELQHKALQEGFRNNPRSNLLRAALGKETIEISDKKFATANEFRHQQSGFAISPPDKWIRSRELTDGDVTWVDPSSTTAYMSLSVLTVGNLDNFVSLFSGRLEPYSNRIGYVASSEKSLGVGSASKVVRFSFLEGSERRLAVAGMAFFQKRSLAIYVYASYVQDDVASVDAAFQQVIGVIDGLSEASSEDNDNKPEGARDLDADVGAGVDAEKEQGEQKNQIEDIVTDVDDVDGADGADSDSADDEDNEVNNDESVLTDEQREVLQALDEKEILEKRGP